MCLVDDNSAVSMHVYMVRSRGVGVYNLMFGCTGDPGKRDALCCGHLYCGFVFNPVCLFISISSNTFAVALLFFLFFFFFFFSFLGGGCFVCFCLCVCLINEPLIAL